MEEAREFIFDLLLSHKISRTEANILLICAPPGKKMGEIFESLSAGRDCVRRAAYTLQAKGFLSHKSLIYTTDCDKISQNNDQRFRSEFDVLYMEARPGLERYLRSRVCSRDDRDDILQAALFKAYTRFETFERGSNFIGWLIRIVQNEISNFFKDKKTWQSQADGQMENQPDDAREQGLGQMEIELSEIERLPAFLQRVLYLHLYGYSYDIMALLERIPEGTAKSRLHRAKGILKDRLPADILKKS